jgi:hypothetical protein
MELLQLQLLETQRRLLDLLALQGLHYVFKRWLPALLLSQIVKVRPLELLPIFKLQQPVSLQLHPRAPTVDRRILSLFNPWRKLHHSILSLK